MPDNHLRAKIAELQRLFRVALIKNLRRRCEREETPGTTRSPIPVATPEEEAEFYHQLEHGEWLDFSEVISSIVADLRGQR